MTEEVTVRTKWNPTSAEMDAYLKREVEMARINIAHSGPAYTLHSQRTILLATAPKP
jgi:hypothetical protein